MLLADCEARNKRLVAGSRMLLHVLEGPRSHVGPSGDSLALLVSSMWIKSALAGLSLRAMTVAFMKHRMLH